MKKTTALLMAAGLIMTAPLIAQERAPKDGDGPRGEMRERMREKMHAHLKQMDANGDQKISREEFDSMGLRGITDHDANKDGKVTKEEFTQERIAQMVAKMEKRLSMHFAQFDRNNDGEISADEVKFQKDQRFAKLDRNDNGELTMDELRGMGKQMRERGRERMKRHKKEKREKKED